MNKKILAIVLSVFLILTTFNFSVIASDFSGHWCENIINELLRDKVISGDANGIRPDDNIRRSEFVTIINNAFGFKAEGTVNFPDVSAEKWYFTQFLAAKDAGYLAGDNNGNANPEKNITRVEAATILSRVLKLNAKDNTVKFSDDDKIPEWGKAYVYALSSNGIIKGYPDGSFGAFASLTRAEGFSLIHSSKYLGISEGTATENVVTGTKTPSGGGSGGGGGGGGGGSAAPSPSLFEVTRKIENKPDENNKYNMSDIKDESLSWSPIANTYNVTIERTTESQPSKSTVKNLTLNTVNLKEIAYELIPDPEDRVPFEKFNVTVTCSNQYGNYALRETVNVVFPHISQPDVSIISEIINDVEKLYFVWKNDTSATSYTLDAALDGNTNVSLTYQNASDGTNKAEISENYIATLPDEINFKLTAASSDKNTVLDMPALESKVTIPLYAGGEGSRAKPYIIKSSRQFQNIEKNNNACFYVVNDITLDQTNAVNPYHVIENFGGSLSGYDEQKEEESIKTITVKSENGNGLFASAYADGFSIRNIKVDGTISGTGTLCSAFIAKIAYTGEFVNCINNADFSVTGVKVGATSPYTGGIVAHSTKDVIFTDCVNTGEIKSSGASHIGGIIGYSNGGSVTLNDCRNDGNVINTSGYSSGIAGEIKTGVIEKCINMGDVSAYRYAGGILSSVGSNGITINNCWNSGKIDTTAGEGDSVAGGIASILTYRATISNCFNTGITETVLGKNGGFVGRIKDIDDYLVEISECYSAPDEYCDFAGELSGDYALSNCYNLASNSSDVVSGLKNITSDELKNISSLNGFMSTDWEIKGVYPYPQLVANPYIMKPKTLSEPAVSVIPSRTSYVLQIENGNANTSAYEVCIYNDSSCTDLVYETTLAGGESASEDISSYLTEYKTYYVKVLAKGDGEVWIDAEEVITSFEKTLFTFVPVIGDIKGDENDVYTVCWTINETEGLSNYLLSIEDKETTTEILSDYEIEKEETSFEISDVSVSGFEPGKEYTVKIKAIGVNSDESSEYKVKDLKTLFAEGDGSASKPYVIRNKRHFENISTAVSSVYYLANDIVLDQTLTSNGYTLITTFSGQLIGMSDDLSEEEIRTIDVKVESDTAVGVFNTVTNVTVKNIRTTGIVTDTGDGYKPTGAFAGNATGVNVFTNCINEAEVKGIGTYTGGIFGDSNGGNTKLISCKNTGDIYASGMYCGGLAGRLKNSPQITLCFNEGDIRSTRAAGGLVGHTNGALTISNCYNIGSITNSHATVNNVGGLVGEGTTNATNCYNAGELITTASAPNVGPISGSGTKNYTACYYLSDETGTETNGLTALSSGDMQISDNFIGFDFVEIWNVPDSSKAYKYPTLK